RAPSRARGAEGPPGREPLDPRRMRQRERGRDGAAERMADQRGLREAESVHESAERVGEVSEAVARARLRGITEAGKVNREHRRAAGERTHVVSPGLGESTQGMRGGG